jgi:hypothetical protein
MRNATQSIVAFLTPDIWPSLALGLGADHPPGPVGPASYWPAGVSELVNRPQRVHGYFVNAEVVFFYAGDTQALNKFLAAYAKLPQTRLEVILHVGKKKARSPRDQEDRNIAVDWMLYIAPRDRLQGAPNVDLNDAPATISRVEVWLGRSIDLDKLQVPRNVTVKSAGEIEKFLERHTTAGDAAR